MNPFQRILDLENEIKEITKTINEDRREITARLSMLELPPPKYNPGDIIGDHVVISNYVRQHDNWGYNIPVTVERYYDTLNMESKNNDQFSEAELIRYEELTQILKKAKGNETI